MQMLLGIILGVLITVGAAFVYDSSTGRVSKWVNSRISRRTRTHGQLGRGKPRLGRHEATIA